MSSRVPKRVARVVVDRAGGYCEAMCCPNCSGRAEQLHHRKLRSQLGRHEVSNLIHICHNCHSWIHAHTGEAYRIGLLVRGYQEPADVMIAYRNGGGVLLFEDGDLE